MSNDTYSGSSLRNLRASTPEDADGFNIDARALRQIKRFLKNDDGLLQTLADIFTSDNSAILNNFKDSQVYNRNNQVIALRSDIDPNNSSKFSGRWIKLNSQAICATGNANFNTFAYGTSDDFVGIITAIGNNSRWTPNYELSWTLKATQYANCTLKQVVEKHSNRTYRNMLQVNKEANDVAKLQKIYFYTPVGYLANITDVSFSLKNAWSLFSQMYLDIFPNLALSGNLFLPKYKNYKVKITLSKDPVWNPDGIIIGETTIEEAVRNGVYFNNIKNTYTDRAYGYIVFSVVDPQEIELEEDTLWWLVDLEMTINLNMPFNNETYRVTDIEVGKNYESVLPILGMNFWKRLDDGKE